VLLKTYLRSVSSFQETHPLLYRLLLFVAEQAFEKKNVLTSSLGKSSIPLMTSADG